MRIACPACHATYEVPESMLVPGRTTRCARCGQEWLPGAAPPPEDARETAAEPASLAPDAFPLPPAGDIPPDVLQESPQETPLGIGRLADSRAAPRDVAGRDAQLLRAAWGASAVVIVLALLAGYTWRDEFMHAWPPIRRLFGLLGLA